MNVYSPRSWPSSSSSYYHSPMYLRSSSPTTMYYPSRWLNSPSNYYSTSSMLPSTTYLRRADDYPSMTSGSSSGSLTPTMSPSLMALDAASGGSSRTPTYVDWSAFTTGGNSLFDNNFASQNLWSMPPEVGSTKPKFNLFNSFSLNDDGFFGNILNHFK